MAELVLVRSMTRAVPLVLIVALLVSCAGAPIISGPYASRASEDDIEQIKRLASHHPKEVRAEDWAPLKSISFESADRAKVTLEGNQIVLSFTVRKRGGSWSIDTSTVKAEARAIVTS